MSSEPGAYAQFSVNTRSCRVVRYYPTADLAITRACNHGPQLLFSQSAAQLLQLALPMNSFSCDCSRLALAHRDASAIRDPFQGDSSTGQTDFRETKEFMLAFRQPIARIIDFAGMSGKILISYHYPCPDGIFAALTAHLELQQGSLTPVVWLPNTVYQPRQLEELSLEASLITLIAQVVWVVRPVC